MTGLSTGRIPGTPGPAAACLFVDNVATAGTTLAACFAALGFGNTIVFADKHKR